MSNYYVVDSSTKSISTNSGGVVETFTTENEARIRAVALAATKPGIDMMIVKTFETVVCPVGEATVTPAED